MDNPHPEWTTTLDGAGVSPALVIGDLASVFHVACSRALVAAAAAIGAGFGGARFC